MIFQLYVCNFAGNPFSLVLVLEPQVQKGFGLVLVYKVVNTYFS